GRVRPPGRRLGAAALTRVPPARWDAAFRRAAPVLPTRFRVRSPATKMQKLAEVLPAVTLEDMYLRLASHWKDPAAVVRGAAEPPTAITDRSSWAALDDPVERMMYLDTVTYLPDDILTKVDRAAMAVSLESRVPLLDHRVVELAWRLPLDVKVR